MFNVTLINKDSRKAKALKTLKGAYKSIYNFLKDHRQDRRAQAILTGAGIGTENYSDHETVPYTPPKTKNFYNSKAWLDIKRIALIRDNYCCQRCGKNKDDIGLDVDHIKERSKYPELELELNNLQTLCKDCHLQKTLSFNQQKQN